MATTDNEKLRACLAELAYATRDFANAIEDALEAIAPDSETDGSKFRTRNGVTSMRRSRPVPNPYRKDDDE